MARRGRTVDRQAYLGKRPRKQSLSLKMSDYRNKVARCEQTAISKRGIFPTDTSFGFVSHAQESSMSAPGWFKQRCPFVGIKTETAPNSSTGSGLRVFPHEDGIVSSPSRGNSRDVAPQKPLRATCRPSKAASSISCEERASCREHSSRNRDLKELAIGNQQRIGSVLR